MEAKVAEEAIKAAMESLEIQVLNATEAALKRSRAAIERTIQENLAAWAYLPREGSKAPASPTRESRPSLQLMLGDNLFERRRRTSVHQSPTAPTDPGS